MNTNMQKKNFFTRGVCSSIKATVMLLMIASSATGAPFSKTFQFRQPDGTSIELKGSGDEFYAEFQTLDGYPVVFVPAVKAYFYAKVSADGSTLEPTNVQVGKGSPASLSVKKHVHISEKAKKEKHDARKKKWDRATGVSKRWSSLKAAQQSVSSQVSGSGAVMAPPPATTTGTKVGLCLLIDFDDDPATVPQAEVVNFCNGDSYAGYGNNGSVKKYFQDTSDNKLTYSNVVTVYIRIPNSLHPKSWYNDTSKDAGLQGNLLVRDAIAVMKSLPNYQTAILPSFSNLTVDANNQVLACNVFYAGDNGGAWAYGLWPHSWSLEMVGAQELSVGGKKLWNYQITNIGSSLELGTFCHENGHMLMGFPDIYDYGYDSQGGAGPFCLMNSGGHGSNPVEICAYLKRAAGWATTVELTRLSNLTASLTAFTNRVYRYVNPAASTEYYLFENRQQSGRDAMIPASGIAVWHIDELGDGNNQSLVPNSNHQNYEVTLVQADNLWHFQRNMGGDANDLYYLGNTAGAYNNKLSDETSPNASWWNGSSSFINISSFSASSNTMTFKITPPILVVSPASGLAATGNPGGPFSPTSMVYTLTAGASNLTWSANCPSNWVSITPKSGTLAAGKATNVLVAINPAGIGNGTGVTYNATVTFSNSLGNTSRRTVSLSTVDTSLPPPYEYTVNADNTVTITLYFGHDAKVTIPATINGLPVTRIASYAFDSSRGFSQVTVGNNVTTIDRSAFYFCNYLTNVTFGSKVTGVAAPAFESCELLNSISVDELNPAYSSTNGILFNKNKTTIVAYPENKSGTSYTIPVSVTAIGSHAFYRCDLLTNITIPSGVTIIGDGAFYGCSALASAVIPNKVTYVGNEAFYYSGITNVSIGTNVTSIGTYAFACCPNLPSITLPASVNSIGDTAFCDSMKLTAINVNAANATYSSTNGMLLNKSKTQFIRCPPGKSGSLVVPSTVTSFGSRAFYSCIYLTQVTLPSTITRINGNMFQNCSGLLSMTIPNSVTVIEGGAFDGCSSLRAVTIPSGVTSIGGWAFGWCSSLTNLVIPSTVTSIGGAAFYSCYNLPGVSLGEGITAIEAETFTACTSIKTITLPGNVTRIGDGAFALCSSMTNIVISGKVTSIGETAFSGCDALARVTIPASVISLGTKAFAFCDLLTSVYFEGNTPATGDEVFVQAVNLVVYYLAGTTGWGTTFCGYPTAVYTKPSTNLVLNPSFETGGTAPTSWTRASTAVGSTNSAQDGKSSLRLTTTTSRAATTQTIAIQSGTTYDISVWINAKGITKGSVTFDTGDKYDGAGQGQFAVATNSGWTKYSGRFTATNTSVTLRMFASVTNFTGTAYFDNIVLSPAAGNTAPAALAQSVTTLEDAAKAITLAGVDPDGNPLTYSIVTGPTKGTLTGTLPNMLYTPNANYHGADSFTFRVHDGTVYSSSATVSINVTSVNDVPVAYPQSVTTAQNTAKTIALVATDADGDTLSYWFGFDPEHGTATLSGTTVTYTPAANYTGPDSFMFGVYDGVADPVFATVSITVTATTTLPSPWLTQDVGGVGKTGSATYTSGSFTLKAGGRQIGGTADALRYVHQVSTGDCDIKLKVVSLTNTLAGAKSGVMIRESLNGNARAAGVWVSPTNGIYFTYRTGTGSSATNIISTGKKAPYWVRLTRTGNIFKAYYGTTGTNWTQLGANTTISMATNAYIGMGLCSGDTNTLATTVISNVTATP